MQERLPSLWRWLRNLWQKPLETKNHKLSLSKATGIEEWQVFWLGITIYSTGTLMAWLNLRREWLIFTTEKVRARFQPPLWVNMWNWSRKEFSQMTKKRESRNSLKLLSEWWKWPRDSQVKIWSDSWLDFILSFMLSEWQKLIMSTCSTSTTSIELKKHTKSWEWEVMDFRKCSSYLILKQVTRYLEI